MQKRMQKKCRWAAALVLSGLAFCGCGGGPAAKVTELEGAWVGQEVAGFPGECRLTVAGDQMKFQGARSNEWYEASLTLDQTARPRRAIIHISACPLPQYVNKDAHGIYKLENTTLTIAANEPGVAVVPTEFLRSATNHSRVFVFTKR
jgi:uncharacterized protein (TIGR03067 family)